MDDCVISPSALVAKSSNFGAARKTKASPDWLMAYNLSPATTMEDHDGRCSGTTQSLLPNHFTLPRLEALSDSILIQNKYMPTHQHAGTTCFSGGVSTTDAWPSHPPPQQRTPMAVPRYPPMATMMPFS